MFIGAPTGWSFCLRDSGTPAGTGRALRGRRREGFCHVYRLGSEAEIGRQRLWTERREERGPFDIIGDVHGCADELGLLLARLGYTIEHGAGEDGEPRYRVTPPPG